MSISKVFYTLLDDKSATFESADIRDGGIICLGHDVGAIPLCVAGTVQTVWDLTHKEEVEGGDTHDDAPLEVPAHAE